MDAYQRQRRLEELRKQAGLAPADPATPTEQATDDDGDALISKETAEKLAKAKELAKGGALKAWGFTKDASAKAKEKAEVLAEKTKEKAKAREQRRQIKEDLSADAEGENTQTVEEGVVKKTDDTSVEAVKADDASIVGAQEFPPVPPQAQHAADQAPTKALFKLPAVPTKTLLIVGAGVAALLAVVVFFFVGGDNKPVAEEVQVIEVPAVPVFTPSIEHSEEVVEPEVVAEEKDRIVLETVEAPTVVEPVVVATPEVIEPTPVAKPVEVETPKPQPAKASGGTTTPKPAPKPAKKKPEVVEEESWQDKANRDIDAWGDKL